MHLSLQIPISNGSGHFSAPNLGHLGGGQMLYADCILLPRALSSAALLCAPAGQQSSLRSPLQTGKSI